MFFIRSFYGIISKKKYSHKQKEFPKVAPEKNNMHILEFITVDRFGNILLLNQLKYYDFF